MDSGEVIPVTILKVSPVVVTQVKSAEGKDQYAAVQVGVKSSIAGSKKANKALAGHLKNLKGLSYLTEFRIDKPEEFAVGKKIDISGFQIGEMVNVIGTMKGRGFAGAMKRHGFHGFPASHGHDHPRSVGSIGQRFPQHVRKGMRMSGHMGDVLVTVKNLQVVDVDVAKHLLAIKGAVPGTRNGVVKIISTGKVKPLVAVVAEKEEKKKK